MTAGHDHAKTSEKALTDTGKFGFYLRSFSQRDAIQIQTLDLFKIFSSR